VKCNTESWNGTSWTELNDLNTARNGLFDQLELNTAALAFGGSLQVVQVTLQTQKLGMEQVGLK
jgi:hypothetical protein